MFRAKVASSSVLVAEDGRVVSRSKCDHRYWCMHVYTMVIMVRNAAAVVVQWWGGKMSELCMITGKTLAHRKCVSFGFTNVQH
jgi:hypothetical protein